MQFSGYSGPAVLLSGWKELGALSVRRKEWAWQLKKHPRFDDAAFYRFVCATHEHRFEEVGADLVTALKSADVMLLWANASTSAAHAILAGIPVVCFKPPAIPKTWESPLEKGGAIVVADFQRLEEELDRLLREEEYRRGVLERQQAFLKEALVAVGDVAVGKTCAALEELARPGTGRPEPDPAARWIADMTMTLEYGMRGVWPWHGGFKQRLAELAAQGRKLTFAHLDFLNTAELPDYFMNVTLLAVWWRPEGEWGIRRGRPWLGWILWRVWRALPDSIRPRPAWLISYLRRTLEEEAVLNPNSRFWRWLGRMGAPPPALIPACAPTQGRNPHEALRS